MGKWASRLAEKTTAPPFAGTDRTDKRGVLSVLAVTPEGGASDFQAVPMPATGQPSEKPAAPDLSAVAWTDADIAAFLARRARLMRWGWAEPNAERLAERLVIRDREADARVSCITCSHYRPATHICRNHKGALLQGGAIAPALAVLPQNCPGWAAKEADDD